MVFLIPLLCDLTLMWIAIGIRRQIHQPQFYKAILMDVPPHVKHIALLFAEVGILLTCHLFLKVSTHDHGNSSGAAVHDSRIYSDSQEHDTVR